MFRNKRQILNLTKVSEGSNVDLRTVMAIKAFSIQFHHGIASIVFYSFVLYTQQ